LDLSDGEILMETIPDIAVAALEIAPVRYLEFKIPERGDGGWV
jgi:hypothetical protein